MAPCLGSISRIVRNNNHTKIIVVVDNITPHEKRIGDNLLNNYFVNSVDGFLTMSETVYQDLDKFDNGHKKVLGVHPIYDNFGVSKTKTEALNCLKLDQNSKYLLFFGIIRKYKGLDILLEAISNYRFKEKNIKLIVAGEFYEDETPYLDMIKLLNI